MSNETWNLIAEKKEAYANRDLDKVAGTKNKLANLVRQDKKTHIMKQLEEI